MALQRPETNEYDAYYGLYIDQAPAGDVLAGLKTEVERTRDLLSGLTTEQETFRYAEGKWNLRDIIGHLIDVEWTFSYRGMCFARQDPAALPGFDQDLWARESNAGDLPLTDLLETLTHARHSSLAIFRSYNDEAWLRRGVANGLEFSVRAMPYILWGHEIHHRKVIEKLYLPQMTSKSQSGGA